MQAKILYAFGHSAKGGENWRFLFENLKVSSFEKQKNWLSNFV